MAKLEYVGLTAYAKPTIGADSIAYSCATSFVDNARL